MQINAPATVTPLVNINQPTEALKAEVRRTERIPESASATNSSGLGEASAEPDTRQRSAIGDSGEQSEQAPSGDGEQAPNQDSEERAQQRAEQAEINQLKATDRKVRAHEAAHAAVGGALAGPPSYTYVTGPNGVRYAVAGEVSIDTSEVPNDPEATIEKLLKVQRAALAPVDPSNQDRRIAAQAAAGVAQARAELAQKQASEDEESLTNPAQSTTSESRLLSPLALNRRLTARFINRLQFSGATNRPPIGANISVRA